MLGYKWGNMHKIHAVICVACLGFAMLKSRSMPLHQARQYQACVDAICLGCCLADGIIPYFDPPLLLADAS